MFVKYLLENKTKHIEKKVNGKVIKVNRNTFNIAHKIFILNISKF